MKKLLVVALVLMLGLSGIAFAAVEVLVDGTAVDRTERVDFIGLPASGVAKSGTKVTVTLSKVDDQLYAQSDMFVDDSLYLTGSVPGVGASIWMSQPDGGCSECKVDDAGTTFACVDADCATAPGM